ncbi:NUDIX domain-containing protein [Candidatus Woesearchaeota archaeon]|nr:NUDIX domain-containing protein [Candidatus Woesearchaeota archaeon]
MNKEAKLIFELFTKNHKLKFNEIEKSLDIRSNLLVYHLDKMKKDGLIEKQDDTYSLTQKAEEMLPFLAHLTGKETGVLSVVIAAIVKDNKICFIKRNKRPYQGYWGMVGGKMVIGESIQETAIREAQEETGLTVEFDSIKTVLQEHVKENSQVKHSFLLFLVKLKALSEETKSTEEGEVKWFDLNNLKNEKIIPSDSWMIEKFFNKTIDIPVMAMEEKDGEIISFEEL